MNKADVQTAINLVQPSLTEVEWFIGGSAALVLQNYCDNCNDVDIIQHTSRDPISFPFEYEKRMWSRFYRSLKIDIHFNSVDNLDSYPKCFHNIIRASYYIDKSHSDHVAIVNPWGAGLINWIHHFLDYGYSKSKTIKPTGDDITALVDILGKTAYETISWKVERSDGEQDKDFYEFALKWKPN